MRAPFRPPEGAADQHPRRPEGKRPISPDPPEPDPASSQGETERPPPTALDSRCRRSRVRRVHVAQYPDGSPCQVSEWGPINPHHRAGTCMGPNTRADASRQATEPAPILSPTHVPGLRNGARPPSPIREWRPNPPRPHPSSANWRPPPAASTTGSGYSDPGAPGSLVGMSSTCEEDHADPW